MKYSILKYRAAGEWLMPVVIWYSIISWVLSEHMSIFLTTLNYASCGSALFNVIIAIVMIYKSDWGNYTPAIKNGKLDRDLVDAWTELAVTGFLVYNKQPAVVGYLSLVLLNDILNASIKKRIMANALR